ncbi:MAG: hypothetical protein K5872_22120 [Rhizobiaceae bacterium]|nr:hypothetical protein [Rhizobiaceae bacterium]MCV0408917.1 hypothetical protein [Rhizobiaceae bacterium]
MLVLGLDIASSTGACWMDTDAKPSAWRCLALESEGEFAEEKSTDLALFLYEESQRKRPDFVAIEQPRRDVATYPKEVVDRQTGQKRTIQTVNADQMQLPGMVAAVAAVFDVLGVPWGLVSSRTWRPSYFGRGYKPPHDDWKQAAVDYARLQNILLPSTKKAQRDAAEAIGIASAWMKCTQIPARHHKAFMELRAGYGRVAA